MDVLVFLPGGTQGPSGQRFPILYCWVQLSNSSGVVKVDGRARASVLLDAQTATER